jgi:Acetyltransferase (GNAT) family
MKDIIIHPIVNRSDPLLHFWLDLLQQQFPPDEQVSKSSIEKIVQKKEQGDAQDNILWAVLSTENNEPVGMTWFDIYLDSKLSALWYIAVAPGQEGHGYGGAIMRSIMSHVFEKQNCDLMVMEVEHPNSHTEYETPEQIKKRVEQIKKRNSFYINHQGAWKLNGTEYYQQVGKFSPILMDILVIFHPEKSFVSPEETFDKCKQIFDESIIQKGNLSLSKEI